jgi:hypothetical protein
MLPSDQDACVVDAHLLGQEGDAQAQDVADESEVHSAHSAHAA